VACRDMMPDPAFFADCLRSSFARLVAAAADSSHETSSAEVAAPASPTRGAAAKSKAHGKAAAKSKVRGEATTRSRARASRRKQGGRRRTA